MLWFNRFGDLLKIKLLRAGFTEASDALNAMEFRFTV